MRRSRVVTRITRLVLLCIVLLFFLSFQASRRSTLTAPQPVAGWFAFVAFAVLRTISTRPHNAVHRISGSRIVGLAVMRLSRTLEADQGEGHETVHLVGENHRRVPLFISHAHALSL